MYTSAPGGLLRTVSRRLTQPVDTSDPRVNASSSDAATDRGLGKGISGAMAFRTEGQRFLIGGPEYSCPGQSLLGRIRPGNRASFCLRRAADQMTRCTPSLPALTDYSGVWQPTRIE